MTHAVPVDVRYRDLDPRGHVNHAVYVSYFEEAKADYFESVLGTRLDEAPTVVRALDVEYSGSITLDRSVRVELAVADVGETSFTIEYEIRADGDPVATGTTVSVVLDPEAGEPAPVPDDWRERMDGPADDA